MTPLHLEQTRPDRAGPDRTKDVVGVMNGMMDGLPQYAEHDYAHDNCDNYGNHDDYRLITCRGCTDTDTDPDTGTGADADADADTDADI